MIDAHEAARPGVRLGALLMEPVLQGAGGMMLVDPLFQAAAAEVCLLQGSCNGLLQMGCLHNKIQLCLSLSHDLQHDYSNGLNQHSCNMCIFEKCVIIRANQGW